MAETRRFTFNEDAYSYTIARDERTAISQGLQSTDLMAAIEVTRDWLIDDVEARQDVEKEWKNIELLVQNKHWDLVDPHTGRRFRAEEDLQVNPNPVENIILPMIDGRIGELNQPHDIVLTPKETMDEEAALIFEDLLRDNAHETKNDLDAKQGLWLWFQQWYGTAAVQIGFDSDWRGGRGRNKWVGEVRIDVPDIRTIYIDARCVEDAEEGMRLHKVIRMPIEKAWRLYPEQRALIQSHYGYQALGVESRDSNISPVLTSALTPGVVSIVITWYKGEPMILEGKEQNLGYGLHVIHWIDGDYPLYLHHENYIHYDPEESVQFPIRLGVDYKCPGRVWGYSTAYYLLYPQIMRNKTVELVLHAHVGSSIGQLHWQTGAMTPKQLREYQQFGNQPNVALEFTQLQNARRERGNPAPATLNQEIERLGQVAEFLSGRYDVTQGKTPSGVEAFRALQLLSEQAKIRIAEREKQIKRLRVWIASMQIRLMMRHYTEWRSYRVSDSDAEQKASYRLYDPMSMKRIVWFNDEQLPIQRLGDRDELDLVSEDSTIEDVFSVLYGYTPGEDYEIFDPEFDVEIKATQTKPYDRYFVYEMAKGLFDQGFLNLAEFLYAFDHGVLPPKEQILQRIEQEKQQQIPEIPPGISPEGMVPEQVPLIPNVPPVPSI